MWFPTFRGWDSVPLVHLSPESVFERENAGFLDDYPPVIVGFGMSPLYVFSQLVALLEVTPTEVTPVMSFSCHGTRTPLNR
jgi:hypothetical protein